MICRQVGLCFSVARCFMLPSHSNGGKEVMKDQGLDIKVTHNMYNRLLSLLCVSLC